MSRIGKLPINIPAGVEISVNGNVVTVKGKEGVLTQEVNPSIKVQPMPSSPSYLYPQLQRESEHRSTAPKEW